MVDALETTPQHRRNAGGAPHTPAQRTPADQPAGWPSLGDLITEAHKLARRDALPYSGHIVIERKGSAAHRHDVWILGPFALVDGGWFGQVHGSEHADRQAPRWLRKHERKCSATHWTQFSWIDEASLEPGCGATGVGIGLGPEGPIYCARTAGQAAAGEHTHVPMTQVLRTGLRELADLD